MSSLGVRNGSVGVVARYSGAESDVDFRFVRQSQTGIHYQRGRALRSEIGLRHDGHTCRSAHHHGGHYQTRGRLFRGKTILLKRRKKIILLFPPFPSFPKFSSHEVRTYDYARDAFNNAKQLCLRCSLVLTTEPVRALGFYLYL